MDYHLIEYQILQTKTISSVWQIVGRITKEIMGVKGLKGFLIFKGFQKMFQIFSLKQQIRILKEFLECLETQNSSPKTAAFELCSSFSRDRESSFESRLSTFEYMGGICASNSEILALLGKAYKFCPYYSAWSLVHGIIN